MVSDAQPAPGVAQPSSPRSAAPPAALFTAREWLAVGAVIAALLLLTYLPYLFAYHTAPPDRQFMGVMVNIPDHFQYFSWMREAQTQVLVANQLTPETSQPLLFNLLWWVLGRLEVVTGLPYDALYQGTRWLAGAFVLAATYFFCGVVFQNRLKRWTAFLVSALGSGLGWVWVIDKYLSNLPDLRYPFDIFTSEPNTFFNVLAFPHFAIAAGLIALIFGVVLLGQRAQSLRYAWLAAALALLLSLQHAYDMFIIYPVIGLYALFIWLRDRKFPAYLFKLGVIVVLVSMWPALQAFIITSLDPVWQGVLAQFDNAGAFTPGPLHLPILMGLSWLLAIWALDIRSAWRDRDDTHLFILAWFLAHFPLIYIPLNFQIHLLSGWQVVTAVLAVIGLYTRVLPLLRRVFKSAPPQRLARWASAALVLVVLPANLYIFAWRFVDLRRYDYPFYAETSLLAAFDYLETQVQADSVVLSSLTTGQYLPALTGARSFLGHWAQTLDFYGKESMVSAFFDPAADDEQRADILRQFGVDFVIFGSSERALHPDGSHDPADVPFLEEAFRSGDVVVYRVTL